MKYKSNSNYFHQVIIFGLILFCIIFFGYKYITESIRRKDVKAANVKAEKVFSIAKPIIQSNPNNISILSNGTESDCNNVIIKSDDSSTNLTNLINDDLGNLFSCYWVAVVDKTTFQLDYVLWSKNKIDDKYIKKYEDIEDQIDVCEKNADAIGCYCFE